MRRPLSDNHERFGELSALALVGQASPQECQELLHHLESCTACREEHRDFAEIIEMRLPLLHQDPVLGSAIRHVENISREAPQPSTLERDQRADSALNSWQRMPNDSSKYWPLVGYVPQLTGAACLVLLIAVASLAVGVRRHALRERTLAGELTALKAEVGTLRARLQSKSNPSPSAPERNIRGSKGKQQPDLVLAALQEQLNVSKAELKALKDELEKTRGENVDITVRAQATEESLRKKSQELEAMIQERDQALATGQATRQEVEALSLEISEARESIARDRELLAHDRDIRDLMSARNLRMIDINDVDSKGRTRKPVGRLFFTKGKSLVFYAFDLDRAVPSVKSAAFQVWGSKNPDESSVRSLGIFYRENNANSWVLRFDNPRVLAEIDSVFVTIEPPGGSRKPTGARLLETTLKTEMNHP